MQITQVQPERKHAAEKPMSFSAYAFPGLVVLAIYFIAIAIAGPQGNFPINDDMLYGTGVRSIVETGRFHVLGSNAFDFIPIQLGSLICSITGFSYDALRATTVGFHLFGLLGLFLSLKEIGLKRWDNAIFTGLYALNPFVLYLSCTFMTDIPALAFTNWVFYFVLRGLKSRSLLQWGSAMLCLTAAMAVRQSALSFLPTLMLSGLLSLQGLRNRLIYASSVALPLLSYFALQEWLKSAIDFVDCYDHFSNSVFEKIIALLNPATLCIATAKVFCLLGMVALPLTIPVAAKILAKSKDNRAKVVSALVLALAFTAAPLFYVLVTVHKEFMPFYQNLWSPPYIGTYQVIDAELIWPKKHLLTLGLYASIAATLSTFCIFYASIKDLTVAGLASVKKGIPAILRTLSSPTAELQFYLVSTFAVALMAVVVQLLTNGLDRYLCALLAPVLLLFAKFWNDYACGKFSRILMGVGILGLCVYGTLTLSDSMNFNRAQWQAIRTLEAKGIDPLSIDAGPEYNYEHGGLKCIAGFDQVTKSWPENRRGGPVRSKLRWWAINGEDYIVSCKPIDNYTIVGQIPYWNTIRWRSRPVYMLKANRLVSADESNGTLKK